MEFLKQLEDQPYLQESAIERLPQEAVGKSPAAIAKLLEPGLKQAGIKLDKPAPFKDDKKAIWSIKSDKIQEGDTAYIWFHSRPKGGRGVNKPRNLSLGFSVRGKDGEDNSKNYRRDGTNLLFTACISYQGLGEIYDAVFK